jgi:uncharacterized membrane protein (DUF106 family)
MIKILSIIFFAWLLEEYYEHIKWQQEFKNKKRK